MAKNKVYAIKKGVNPETNQPVENLILEQSWGEVEKYIKGVAEAIFKGFKTKEEAEGFLNQDQKKSSDLEDSNALSCYVDGSYNKNIPNYGYGLVCVNKNEVIHVDYGAGTNKSAIDMFQVGGELLGAMKALLFAKSNGFSNVHIYHDYLGVAHHATGEWKRKTEFSKVYYEWMQQFFNENPEINIEFKKVAAHTGNDFNELADGYAKLAVELKPNAIFYKMAEEHCLFRKFIKNQLQ